MSNIFKRIEAGLDDWYRDDRNIHEEPGGVVLSDRQLLTIHAHADAMKYICSGDQPGVLLICGLRVIKGAHVAGPLIVSKGFVGALSWYPKLGLTVQGSY